MAGDHVCSEGETEDNSLMERGDRRLARGRTRSRSRSRLPRSSHSAAPKSRNENCRRTERGTSRREHPQGGAASGAGSSTDRPGRATIERVRLLPGSAPVRQGGDHVRRVPPPPGEEPQNVDFTIFPAPPTSTDQAVDIWRHLLGTGPWGEESSPPVRRGGPYIPDARAEYMNAVLTSYSVEAQAIVTLGLITAVRAMLTELGQICHGASLVEVQVGREDEEGDGTLMVQSKLVHWRGTSTDPSMQKQYQVDDEEVALVQGAWVKSFGLVQRLQEDLEKVQPGVARLRAVHMQDRLLRNRGQFVTVAGQDLVSQVEAVCVALAGSAENEMATGFAAQPQEVQEWSNRWWKLLQEAGHVPSEDSAATVLTVASSQDPQAVVEMAEDEAAERRDREALAKQQEDFEREQQAYSGRDVRTGQVGSLQDVGRLGSLG